MPASPARRVQLEGFHAVKHALRFGAVIHRVLTDAPGTVEALAAALAPDVWPALQPLLVLVTTAQLRALTARPLASPVVAEADARPGLPGAMLGAGDRPLVLLEQPRHAGNVGATVRVAAAAGAAGVLTTGELDPWGAAALRGAAGLQYALPVAATGPGWITDRRIVALDPDGDRLDAAALSGGPLLVFGTERGGLSDELLARADARVALPMTPGVSSLNLATAVAATLFSWRLAQP